MTSRSEKKISYGRNILILLLLMAATFAVIFRGDDFPAFLSALKDADGRWLLLGLLCMFLFVGCEAANMHQISHTLGFPLKYFRCGQYAFIGFYFSSITPSVARMRARLRSERFTKCSPRSTTHPPRSRCAKYSTEGRYAKGRTVMAPPSRRCPGSVRRAGRAPPPAVCCARRPYGPCRA